MTGALAFVHKFEPASDPTRAPILLLHGTGGDESDLLPLGRGDCAASRRSSRRAARSSRTVCRASFADYARASSMRRTCVGGRTSLPISSMRRAGAYCLAKPVAVGFSNGANIAAAVLLLRPETLAGAVSCQHGAVSQSSGVQTCRNARSHPLGTPGSDCSGRKRCAARSGPGGSGTDVQRKMLSAGHGITEEDLALAAAFLDTL